MGFYLSWSCCAGTQNTTAHYSLVTGVAALSTIQYPQTNDYRLTPRRLSSQPRARPEPGAVAPLGPDALTALGSAPPHRIKLYKRIRQGTPRIAAAPRARHPSLSPAESRPVVPNLCAWVPPHRQRRRRDRRQSIVMAVTSRPAWHRRRVSSALMYSDLMVPDTTHTSSYRDTDDWYRY